jgi:uncharacterized repeat protein (TIGR01451 family)
MIASLAIAMGMLMTFLMILGGVGTELPKVWAADLKVCSDPGECYTTIQAAVDAAVDNDVIKIAEGTYYEHVTISGTTLTLIGGYAPPDWITPDPDNHPTRVDGQESGQVMKIMGGISVTLQGLILQRGKTLYAQGANLHVEDSPVLITHCTMISATNGTASVYLKNSDYTQMINTHISNNDIDGLYIYNTTDHFGTDVSLFNLTVTNNNGHGIEAWRRNLHLSIQDSLISNNQGRGISLNAYNDNPNISNNTITHNGEEGIFLSSSNHSPAIISNTIGYNLEDGIFFESSNIGSYDRPNYKANRIISNTGYGINANNSSDFLIQENQITHNGQGGIAIDGGNGQQLSNNILIYNGGTGILAQNAKPHIMHNTLVSNATTALVAGAQSHITLTNNIVSSHTVGIQTNARTAYVQASYTLWFNNAIKTSSAGGGVIELTDDIEGNPDFKGGQDIFDAYHIMGNSAAIDAGTPVTVQMDIDGENRAAPDIGADEFAYALWLVPSEYRRTVHTTAPTAQRYTHTLTNTGSVTQTFEITADLLYELGGWSIDLAPKTVRLASGLSATVVVTVDGIGGASVNDVDSGIITASVQSQPTVFKTARDVTLIGRGAQVSPGTTRHVAPEPGDTLITYTHVLTNIGEQTDDFNITLTSVYGWAVLNSPAMISNLADGDTETITVVVTVPYTAAADLIETVWVTATSTAQTEAFDTAVDTTVVSTTQGTRYIATTAPATDHLNNCLLDTFPCHTLAQAVAQAVNDDMIKMATGTYTDADAPLTGALAWIRKPLTIRGGYDTSDWNAYDPTQYPTILNAEGEALVILAEGDGITLSLQGLTLANGEGDEAGTLHVLDARLLMSRCTVLTATVNNALSGGSISLSNSDGTQILASRIEGSNRAGVYAAQSTNLLLTHNVISGNTADGIEFKSSGGDIMATLAYNDVLYNQEEGIHIGSSNNHITVLSNTIIGNGPASGVSGRGIYFVSRNENLDVHYNFIAENQREGMSFENYDHVDISYNTVSGNGNGGTAASVYPGMHFGNNGQYVTLTGNIVTDNIGGGIRFKDSADAYILNNFIVGNLEEGLVFDQSTDNLVINNIIADNGTDGVRMGNWRATANSAADLIHNTIVNNGEAGVLVDKVAVITLTNNIVASHTVGLYTESDDAHAWIDHTLWYDNEEDVAGLGPMTMTHDLWGNPHFVSGAVLTDAYHVRYNSAAIDAGAVTSVTTDIDGEARPCSVGACDIGADEFPYALQFSPDYRSTVDVSTAFISYTHHLRNSGALTQGISLTTSTDLWSGGTWPHTLTLKLEGQPAQVIQANDVVTLSSGASAVITLTLKLSNTTDVGNTLLTAQSQQAPSVWKQVEDVTMVGGGVEMDPSQSKDAIPPGDIVTYTHTVTNTGTEETSFNVSLRSAYGWATLITPPPLTLTGNATGTVQFSVSVPLTAAGDLQETIWLTVAHPTVERMYASVEDSAGVKPLNGVRYVATTGRADAKNNCLYTPYPCRTVAQAAAQAQDGDAIHVATGTYTDANTAQAGAMAKFTQGGVYLQGGYNAQDWAAPPTSDPTETVLDAQGDGKVLDIRWGSALTVTNLTLQGGSTSNVYARSARLTMIHCNVLYATAGYGLHLSQSDNAVIQRTRVFNNADHGIYLFESKAMTLTNSIIAENAGHGLVLEGTDGDANYASATLYHTTFASNTQGSAVVVQTSKVTLKNTIVASQTVGISGTSAVDINGSADIVDADYTLWHAVGNEVGGGSPTRIKWDEIGYTNVYGDPDFTNATDVLHAYHITPGSDAADSALTITGIDEDIDGQARPAGIGPDIGADEIAPSLALRKYASSINATAETLITYTIILTNTGEVTLTATITDSLSPHVTPLSSPIYWEDQEILPHELWTNTIRVTPNPGYTGAVVNEVNVTTVEGPAGTASVTISIQPLAGVQLSPNRSTRTMAGPVVYTHTLTNTGTTDDVFNLTHHSSQGWNVSYSHNPISMGYRGQPSATKTVYITLTVPTSTPSGTLETTTLTATSSINTDVHAAVIDTTTVFTTSSCPSPLDDVGIDGPSTGYTDTQYTFTAVITPADATEPVTYTWSPAPASGQDTSSAQYQWSTPGTYTITLTAENCGNSASATHQVVIQSQIPGCPYPLQDVSIDGPSLGYTGTYTFTSLITPANATTPVSYTWSPAPTSGQSTSSAQYQWNTPDIYTITLTAANCGNAVSVTHQVVVQSQIPGCPFPLRDVGIDGPVTGYTDTPYTFMGAITPANATTPVTYTWDPAPASGQESSDAQYEWSTPGTYTITLTAENCGATVSATHQFIVQSQAIDCPHPLQDVGIDGPSSGYTGTQYTFTGVITPADATTPVTYTWDPTPASGQETSRAQYQWGAPGIYTITMTAENCGGQVSTTHRINVETKPPECPSPLSGVGIGGPSTGYTGTQYTFTAVITPTDATKPVAYTWSPDPASGQGTASAQYQWAHPGIYTVTLIAENCGGRIATSHRMIVQSQIPGCPFPLHDIGIDGPATGYTGTLYTFTGLIVPINASEPVTYTWSPAPASGQGSPNAQYQWSLPGLYTVTFVVENCGGRITTTHAIAIQSHIPGCPFPLRDVAINGPTHSYPGQLEAFSAVVTPSNATLPLTYAWTPPPLNGQNQAHAEYQWITDGTHTITLTVENCGNLNQVTRSHSLVVYYIPPGSTFIYPDATQPTVISLGTDYPITITIPPGAVEETTALTYTTFTTATQPPTGFQSARRGFSLDAYQRGQRQPGLTFTPPITVTITYSKQDVENLRGETLALYYWDGTAWSQEGITLLQQNPDANTLSVTIAHLTKFAIFGEVNERRVYLPLVLRQS